MTEDNEQPNWFSPDDPRQELAKLVARRDLLVRALREAEDPAARADLAHQLRVASQQIEAMSWTSDGEPAADHQYPPAAVTADLPSNGIVNGIGPNGFTPHDPTHGDPNHGYPNHSDPNHGDPNHDYPSHGDPNHSDPSHGDPNHGYPNHGYPNHSGVGGDDLSGGDSGGDRPGDLGGGFGDGESGAPDESPAVGEDALTGSGELPPLVQDLSDSTFAETMAQALSQDLPPVDDAVAEEDLDWDPQATIEHTWSDLSADDSDESGRYAWPEPVAKTPPAASNPVADDGWDQPVDAGPGSQAEPMADSSPISQDSPTQGPDPAHAEQEPPNHRHSGHRFPDPTDREQPYPEQVYSEQPYRDRSPADQPDQRHPDSSYQDQRYHDHSYREQPYPDSSDQNQSYAETGPADGLPSDEVRQPRPVVDSVSPGGPARWPNGTAGGGGKRPAGRAATESRHAPITDATAGPVGRNGFAKPSGPVLAVVGVSLALLAGVLWFGGSRDSDDQANQSVAPASPQAAPLLDSEGEAVLTNVQAVLRGLGLSSVSAELRDGVVYLTGPVASQAEYDSASTAVRSVADTYPIDTSGLVVQGEEPAPAAGATVQVDERAKSLQTELDRILASTPLIFGPGQAALTELHRRILNNAVIALQAYPGFTVTIAGFTDDQGDEAQNRQLSLSRAENVRAYLVEQGLPAESFPVEARGEETASGSSGLAGLERRVEFEVEGTAQPAGPQETIRVAIVAPSASNDLAFTQSMVDAVNVLAAERPIELAVTDNTFVPDDAAAAVKSYAEQGFDLVIAHGSQFGSALLEIAPQHPETAFAWGTASDTFGQPNVYAYDAAAQEGGYVMGVMAGLLSESSVIGVVGPIEVGDAAQYVRGFEAGARAETPGTDVQVTYTGSFSDIGLASEAAQTHLGAGADVLTGSAQMVVGAIAAAEPSGALWFGTQANQSSLAPGIVVASQVYHWEVALRDILNDVEGGTLSGKTYTANLANGGLVIEYNPDYPLSPEVRQRADQLSAAIANGSVTPPS